LAEQLNWEKKDILEDVKIILAKILRRWYWVVLVFIISLLVAFTYIRYQDEIYVVNTSFITKKFDQRDVNIVPALSGMSFADQIEINQEIPLLKSESRISETLNRLDFGVTYMVEGRLKTTELYQSHPFRVITSDSSAYVPYGQEIYLDNISENSFALSTEDEVLNNLLSNQTFLFNRVQNVNGWEFKIEHSYGNGINSDYRYYFIIHNPKSLVNRYRAKLNISWAERGSAILNARISTKIPEKDYDFLTTYLEVIIEFGLIEKKEHLRNSIQFIDSYMSDVTDTLLRYQDKIDEFRLSNRDVISGSTMVIDKLNALEEEKMELILESNYYNYLEEYIRKQKTEEVFAPNLIGLEVPPLDQLINEYMSQKWADKIDKNENNEKNPLVIKGNEELERRELNIYESVKNLTALNQEKISEVNQKINFYMRSIDELQVEYRQYINLERLRAIYEELFNTLLKRKTDASINMASVTSDYQMVTEPAYGNTPVSPDVNKIYMIAFILGLGLPIGFILLVDYINPKVISREDLKRHTDIPLIGSVGHFKGKTQLAVHQHPKSQVAESFRVIRANLEYINSEVDTAKIILITSSISGEGKTFCSTNLAYTYANTGKKTLLVGADMRKPALAKNFGLERSRGLSNYLSGQNEIEEVFYETEVDTLHVIPGGHVPPNPAELLTGKRIRELMEYISKAYEVVVFDTPPIGLVSDTVELIKFSFIPLLIVRQDKTYKKSLDAITEMYHAGKFKNLGIIMNDVHYSKYDYGAYYGRNYGYGSGHGYGYYDDEHKKGFWKRLFRS